MSSEHRFTTKTTNGVDVALTTGGPKFEGDIFAYEKMRTITPDAHVDESYLSRPGWMTIDEQDRIYVADGDRVASFNPDGTYRGSFGGRGEGPAEFGVLNYIEIVDDILWAQDWNRLRSHLFQLDGTYVRTVTIPEQARAFGADGIWWGTEEGHLVLTKPVLRRGSETMRREELRVVSSTGRTIARLTTPWVLAYAQLEPADQGSPVQIRPWFGGVPQARFVRGRGIYVTSGVEPVIDVYDLTGTLKRKIIIELEEQWVTSDDRAWVREQLDDRVRRASDDRARRRARIQRDNARLIDPKGYWRGLEVDEWGFIWLRTVADSREVNGRQRMLVLSPDGEYMGQTFAPIGQAHRGYLLGTETDPGSGEIFPVVYKIHPAVGGFDYQRE